MRLKAPKVPPASVVAGEATIGPRVVPGTYTVKLTRGKDVLTTSLVVGVDPRANYTVADRKLEFDASMRVYRLLGDLTFDVDKINGVRDSLLDRAGKIDKADPFEMELVSLADKADVVRKKIVATKEGGAVTGEERIREKTSQLYGALVFYEGKPADYYIARIDSLSHERQDVADEFSTLINSDLKTINQHLPEKKLAPIHPLDRAEWDKNNDNDNGTGGAPAAQSFAKLLRQGWR
jgi:hypothetical protein